MVEESGSEEQEATLELGDGLARVPVLFTLRSARGITTGYLRLAYGHGGSANRVLSSVGATGRLHVEAGASHSVRITSSDPGEAPGYLCAFALSPS